MEKKIISDVTKKVRYGQSQPTMKNKQIVNVPTYETNGEYLLIVKDVESCTIYLNAETTEAIKIKVLTKTNIISTNSLIDELYEEIEIDNGACIELEYVAGGWYIISSDGMKMN
jgi:hypothetical protein